VTRVLVVLLCLSQTGCFFAARHIYKALSGDDDKSKATSGAITQLSGDSSGVVYKVKGDANPDPTATRYCSKFDKAATQSHATIASDNSYTTYYYDCR